MRDLDFQQGQGLGRSEQGMSQALSVEKTSKRGGRIVHEKDLMPPPPFFGETSTTPPHGAQDDEFAAPAAPGPSAESEEGAEKPTITDLMKNPSKVVLCKVSDNFLTKWGKISMSSFPEHGWRRGGGPRTRT